MMQRYHSPVGSGDGTSTRTVDYIKEYTGSGYAGYPELKGPLMRPDDWGTWVKYSEAAAENAALREEAKRTTALAESRQKQIDHLKQSIKDFDEQLPAYKSVYDAWVRTCIKLGMSSSTQISATEAEIDRLIRDAKEEGQTRTSQLINELYHDRARLERVVADAVAICEAAVGICDEQDQMVDGDWEPEFRGHAQQFIDTHKVGE